MPRFTRALAIAITEHDGGCGTAGLCIFYLEMSKFLFKIKHNKKYFHVTNNPNFINTLVLTVADSFLRHPHQI